MKNGKGKDYYLNGEVSFEGEYLNKKKWNGKGYDENRNITFELTNGNGLIKIFGLYEHILEFEGEYLNGEINGRGKKYDYEGRLMFERQYLNGLKNRNGNQYKNGKLRFEGQYENGRKMIEKLKVNLNNPGNKKIIIKKIIIKNKLIK